MDATTIWEVSPTAGASVNGAGFANLDPGTSVDYSDNAGPIYNQTDGATSGTGVTTFTSATAGFTAAMAGNVLQITAGTNDQVGWYQITVYTNTSTVTLDRAPDNGGGGVSGATFAVGGAFDILTDNFVEQLEPGNTVHIKNDGTMTLGGSIFMGKDGTPALPIVFAGYNSSRGDMPTGTNRPLIANGGNTFDSGNYVIWKHIRFTTTNDDGFQLSLGGTGYNLASNNSSGTGDRAAINIGGAIVVACDLQSVGGYAVELGTFADDRLIYGSYLHDSVYGVYVPNGADQERIINNVIDTNSTSGIEFVTASFGHHIVGNTIYGNGVGINGISGNQLVVINNILDGNTTGAIWTTQTDSNYWDYNIWDNTADVTLVTKGENAITGDPGLTNPDAGDFTLTSGSNAIGAGVDVTNTLVTGDYKNNIGADQDDVAGAAAGPVATGAMMGVF